MESLLYPITEYLFPENQLRQEEKICGMKKSAATLADFFCILNGITVQKLAFFQAYFH